MTSTLNAVIQFFSQDTLASDDVSSDHIWLPRNRQLRKYSQKSHILIIQALTVTLTLKTFFIQFSFAWKKNPFSPFTLILSVQTHSVCGTGKCHLLRADHLRSGPDLKSHHYHCKCVGHLLHFHSSCPKVCVPNSRPYTDVAELCSALLQSRAKCGLLPSRDSQV